MTDFRARWNRLPADVRLRVAYLLAGIPFGVLWLVHAGDTPVEHALRLLGLIAVVMVVSACVRSMAARRGRHLPHPPLGKFIVLKVGLVALALAAGVVLDGRVASADVWIGFGLIAVVAVVGPSVHPWLTASMPSRADDSAVPVPA